MAKIKFFLDEHIPKAVAKGLRARGVEVLTCAEADRLTVGDEDHLLLPEQLASLSSPPTTIFWHFTPLVSSMQG
jgi:hypothetical protein